MNIKIDRSSGVPIYKQIKNEIIDKIKNGELKIGTKMSTERDLAKELNISRNTISTAYNLLEQEGILVSYQGRGTFVAEEAKTWEQNNNKTRLVKMIDLDIEEAFEMGFDADEFMEIVQERVKEKEELFKKTNAIFVECNIEQAKEFAKQLSEGTHLNVTPVVLSSLENRNENLNNTLNNSSIIIATFNHVNDVKNFTSDLHKDVVGVAINPSLETIVKIARYPEGTRFAFFCISNEFKFKVENALKSAGLDNLKLTSSITKDGDGIKEISKDADVIIVSPGRMEDVKKVVGPDKEIISFDYNLDSDSVKAIIPKIVEMKNKN